MATIISIYNPEKVLESPKTEMFTYEKNVACNWKFSALSGEVFRVSFSLIDMETSENCIFDHVQIYDGKWGEISAAKLCNPIEDYCPFDRSAKKTFLPHYAVKLY